MVDVLIIILAIIGGICLIASAATFYIIKLYEIYEDDNENEMQALFNATENIVVIICMAIYGTVTQWFVFTQKFMIEKLRYQAIALPMYEELKILGYNEFPSVLIKPSDVKLNTFNYFFSIDPKDHENGENKSTITFKEAFQWIEKHHHVKCRVAKHGNKFRYSIIVDFFPKKYDHCNFHKKGEYYFSYKHQAEYECLREVIKYLKTL